MRLAVDRWRKSWRRVVCRIGHRYEQELVIGLTWLGLRCLRCGLCSPGIQIPAASVALSPHAWRQTTGMWTSSRSIDA